MMSLKKQVNYNIMDALLLKVVSQERQLLSKTIEKVSVPTAGGEVTILPNHIGLFAKVVAGEVRYDLDKHSESIVVSDGFVNVSPDGRVIVMVDSATYARDISLQKAKRAIKEAKEAMKQSIDRKELMMAEASLRLAMLEVRIAKKTKKRKI